MLVKVDCNDPSRVQNLEEKIRTARGDGSNMESWVAACFAVANKHHHEYGLIIRIEEAAGGGFVCVARFVSYGQVHRDMKKG